MDGLNTVPNAGPGSDPGANSTASFLSEQAEKHLRDCCELDSWASGGQNLWEFGSSVVVEVAEVMEKRDILLSEK